MKPAQHYFVEGIIWNGMDRIIQRFIKNVDPIYAALGLAKEAIGVYGTRQPLSQYIAFYEVGAELTANPYFGLHAGGIVKAHRAGLPGQMCLYSKTLHDAIVNLSCSLPTLIQGVEFSLTVGDEEAVIYFRILDKKIKKHRQFDEHALAFFISMLRGTLGRRWAPKEVMFQHSHEGSESTYRRFFNAPIKFDQPVNAIIIDQSDLSRRGNHYNPFLLDTLKYYARKDIEHSVADKTITDQTVALLEEGLQTGRADIQYIAEQLSMSIQTLQRRLKKDGSNFRELLEKTRIRHACRYLENNNMQVSHIAERLGYSETSAFSRAFQKSMGLTPSQYRKQK